VDNTDTPRFIIVWGLIKEGGEWKLDDQISARGELATLFHDIALYSTLAGKSREKTEAEFFRCIALTP
jgi:hypothetical protein